MISRIFIDRPVFAWVIAIAIMLGGIGGLLTLSVEQYPDIAPPSVNIRANYPGASAEVLEASVTQVIEQQLTGIDGLIYFRSTSNSTGQVSVNVTFEKGTDPDIAQVQVQNKAQQALSRLPQQVQQQGLVVTKSNPDFLMVVSIYDATDQASSGDISDYLVSNLQERIGRLEGVGDFNVFGSQYAMRVWLDPFKLASFQLMPSDVITAIQAQNNQVAAGQLGGQPAPDIQMLNVIVTARTRLTNVDQFKDILVKVQPDGSRVMLQDVARVELGNENYNTLTRLNGHPASGMSISLAPGADALRTAELVRQEIIQQSESFPPGYEYAFPNDSTAFIELSIDEVVHTLFEAVVLVVIVMFIFLQSWRATLIPAIAVPVVMLGTFGVLAIAGFSVNVLTLFALVLSVGLLVDDAIVVVENVERIMHEEPDIQPRDAVIRSMNQVQMALIAIALVLSAVFLPMAFFGGSVGVIYRQFSITIVTSMVLSVLVALVLTPVVAAGLLRPPGEAHHGTWFDRALARFGVRFNAWFDRSAIRYRRAVDTVIKRMRSGLLAYAALVAMLAVVFALLPTSFLPDEDQGIAQLRYILPPGATQARTLEAVKTMENYFLEQEGANTNAIFTILGQGPAGAGQNTGRGFLSLMPWDQREEPQNAAAALTRRATQELSRQLRDVQFNAVNPPPVRGLGQASGFTAELMNNGTLSREEFESSVDRFLVEAREDPLLAGVGVNALPDVPTLNIDVDEQKIGALSLIQSQVDATLATAWGGNYVGDFIDRGRVKRVYVQGDAPYRSRPEDLASWFVRSANGQMAPFSSFAQLSWGEAPSTLTRFNGAMAVEVEGDAAPGQSTGQAMDRVEAIASGFPGVSVAWSGLSYQERISGGQAPLLYGISLVVVFLCLAALYESWSVPLSVLLTVPLGLLGAALAVTLRGLTNDVYFQVGLLTTMGLSAKNAILIVEFAEASVRRGKDVVEAAIEAAFLRLRPILMTSCAFIGGVLPLALATGAGAQSRMAIGTAVIGGMLSAVALAIFFVPLFFVLVRRLFARREPQAVADVLPEDPLPEPFFAENASAEDGLLKGILPQGVLPQEATP